MKIAIIGHGNVGGTLAKVWAEAGLEILIGIRKQNDERARKLAGQSTNIQIGMAMDVINEADVIFVAVPAPATLELAKSWGNLSGKVIIDATNALWEAPEPFETGYHAFESLNQAEVVKAFNTTGFENMRDPRYGNTTADMFMAGSSVKAKTVVRQLAEQVGFETTYDFGGADKVKALEHFAFGWINLAIRQGQGRNIALKILKR